MRLRDGSEVEDPLLPHDRLVPLEEGDEFVVIAGEQRGWIGRVLSQEPSLDSFVTRMFRPDGTQVMGPVWQRRELCARLLPKPPKFASVEEADAWLAAQERHRPAP